jgi:hypothetical protein
LFILNPGENVGAIPEKSLKQAIYFVRHHIRVTTKQHYQEGGHKDAAG